MMLDGKGDEFIVFGTYDLADTSGTTELQMVISATHWVHGYITYKADVVETWWSSDQVYDNSIDDDCEEYAILLCAIIRFKIGVPAGRV